MSDHRIRIGALVVETADLRTAVEVARKADQAIGKRGVVPVDGKLIRWEASQTTTPSMAARCEADCLLARQRFA